VCKQVETKYLIIVMTRLHYNTKPLSADLPRKINQIISKHTHTNFFYSSMFVVRDVVLMYAVYRLYRALQFIPELLLYPIYSVVMGTVAMGLWVIGHECGHGSFAKSRTANDMVGFVLHSLLLVPYFSWQYSHNKHHKYTNHLIYGETHVPDTKSGARMMLRVRDIVGDDAFSILSVVGHLSVGWPMYLWSNTTGGRTTDCTETRLNRGKHASHFFPHSQVMPDRLARAVVLSTVGCVGTVVGLYWYGLLYAYVGPYLIVNSWLVLITMLQHTNESVPHYGTGTESQYNHTVGALCTVDQRYPAIIDHLWHRIGTTHVAHHLNYSVPHYRAVACTEELKLLLGDRYLYNPDPMWQTMRRMASQCIYVDSTDGVQWYRS